MRPISHSNFINKIISRVLHDKLDHILPRLISANRSRFVKGRNIIENVLLTQEIVSDIRLRGKPANVVLKLNMTKSYDRVSTKVLRKMGLWDAKMECNLNHLAYTDNTIIVSSADNDSLNMIMKVLQDYEKVSGQLNNKRKSSFYMFAKVLQNIVGVAATIGFSRGCFPFVYLRCPISHAKKRKTDYSEPIKKVKDKLQAWKGRLLSPGGKVVLISSVFQSVPIHLLSAVKPPKCVIKEIHQLFANFLE
ncbi:uncharacterized protein LOC132613177 [Lycium barbarum]|uniref:uncharacterized protein LOC132613177 n=1 Tax=Lycium barbarum TaxID=112863 RepID=UPI00293EEED7|nr:uncharacterized protein LOC132613177 [Lycium barbarum]